MANRRIQASLTTRGIDVGDGLVLRAGQTAVVSDAEYAALSAQVLSGEVIDLGATDDPEDVGDSSLVKVIRQVVSQEVVTPEPTPAETFEVVVADLISRGILKHYWPIDEGQGLTLGDQAGSLDLTLSGAHTWMSDPSLGNYLSFSGGRAESQGLGNLPVGTSARCVFVVFRSTNVATVGGHLIGYGGTTATTNCGIETNYNIYRPNIGRFRALATNGQGAWLNTNTAPPDLNHHGDGRWRLAALSQRAGADGFLSRFHLDNIEAGDTTTVTVTATGNLRLADNPGATAPWPGDIYAAGVMSAAPAGTIQRLLLGLSRVAPV